MVQKIIYEMMQINEGDSRRIEHALKVHAFTKSIANGECIEKEMLEVLELSAILHDIGISVCEKKYNSTSGQLQQLEGPPIAKRILCEYGIKKNVINDVVFLIANHHSYKNINRTDHQILIEADLIVNAIEHNITENALKKAVKMLFKTETGVHIATSQFNPHAH